MAIGWLFSFFIFFASHVEHNQDVTLSKRSESKDLLSGDPSTALGMTSLNIIFEDIQFALKENDHQQAVDLLGELLQDYFYIDFQGSWLPHKVIELLQKGPQELRDRWDQTWFLETQKALRGEASDPLLMVKGFFSPQKENLWLRLRASLIESGDAMNLLTALKLSLLIQEDSFDLQKALSQSLLKLDSLPKVLWIQKNLGSFVFDQKTKLEIQNKIAQYQGRKLEASSPKAVPLLSKVTLDSLSETQLIPAGEIHATSGHLLYPVFDVGNFGPQGGTIELKLFVFGAKDGRCLKKIPLKTSKFSARQQQKPVLVYEHEDVCYLDTGWGQLFAIDWHSGVVLWQTKYDPKNKFDGLLPTSPDMVNFGQGFLVASGRYLLVRPSLDPRVFHVDAWTGQVESQLRASRAKLLTHLEDGVQLVTPHSFKNITKISTGQVEVASSPADWPFPLVSLVPQQDGALAGDGYDFYRVSEKTGQRQLERKSLEDPFLSRGIEARFKIKQKLNSLSDWHNKQSPSRSFVKQLTTNETFSISLAGSIFVDPLKGRWVHLESNQQGWLQGPVMAAGLDHVLVSRGRHLLVYQRHQNALKKSAVLDMTLEIKKSPELFEVDLNLMSGERKSFDASSWIQIFGSIALIQKDQHLFCYELSQGQLLWKRKFLSRLYFRDLFFNNKEVVIAAVSPLNQIDLYRLDLLTGQKIWRRRIFLENPQNLLTLRLMKIKKDLAFIRAQSIAFVDQKTGKQKKQYGLFQLETGKLAPNIYLGGQSALVFRTWGNQILVYSLKGDLQKVFLSHGIVKIFNDRLYFFTPKNQLQIYDCRRNKFIGRWDIPAQGKPVNLEIKGDDIFFLIESEDKKTSSLFLIDTKIDQINQLSASNQNFVQLIDGGQFILARGTPNYLFVYSP